MAWRHLSDQIPQILRQIYATAYQYSQPKQRGGIDLLTLKVVSQSRVTWATSVPILVLALS